MFENIKAILAIQRMKNTGSTEMLSRRQIVNLIVNMSDISKKYSKPVVDDCYELFRAYRDDRVKEPYDFEKYLETGMEMITMFELIQSEESNGANQE